jgi:hypothetical protein
MDMNMNNYNYYSDRRVRVMDTTLWVPNMNGKDEVYIPDGGTFHEAMQDYEQNDILEMLNQRWDDELERFVVRVKIDICVCDQCGGTGTMVNPSIDAGGISAHEFAEDPDFAEDYFSGRYDVPCSECNGLRVVGEPQWDLSNPLHERLRDYATDMADIEAERRRELRYGY